MRLTIELLSDLCVGTGEGSGGAVDTETASDEYGIPIIPGKRVKGLFREAAEELVDHGIASPEDVNTVFGVPGEMESDVYFGTLYPAGYRQVRALLEAMKRDRNGWTAYAERAWVQRFYTTVRTQTAINEDGVADENTLRSSRVVCQKCKNGHENQIFEGNVEIPKAMKKKHEELLNWCARMIRHIGINRTRGYGNVRCHLEPEKMVRVEDKNIKDAIRSFPGSGDENSVLGVHLILEQPCVIEENFISGRTMMGGFASAFLRRERAMGNDTSAIHENEQFQALFLSGEVQYGFCWPYENGRVHEPLPKSFLKRKYSDSDNLYDLAACERAAMPTFMEQKEKADGLFVAFEGEETLYYSEVERDTENHHRRPEDRAIGHALGKSEKGDKSTGQLYSFDLISEGQSFFGEVRGKKKLLEELQKLVPDGEKLHLGAGRTAQYGAVRVCYEPVQNHAFYVEPEDSTVITLRSPLAVEDTYRNASTKAEDIVHAIFPEQDFSEIEVVPFFEERSYGGYQAKWRMPLPNRMALAPGSVLVIYGMELSEEEAEMLEQHAYGQYTEEGYGRIAVNRHGENEIWKLRKEQRNVGSNWPEPEKEAVSFLEMCLWDRVYRTCREVESIEKIEKCLRRVPNNTVLAGTMQILRTSESFEELKQQLLQASGRASKTNAQWCAGLLQELFGSNRTENQFIRQSIADMERDMLMGLPVLWEPEKRWRAMLNGNAGFQMFRQILDEKLCQVHLEKGRRES